MRILVVEDDPNTRALLKEMLVRLGHEIVAEAEDSSQALRAYAAHRPDVVSLDLGLGRGGVTTGLRVLDSLRAQDSEAKVLAITGNAQEKLRELALEAGAYMFVNKPISLASLKLAVLRAKFV